MRIPPFGIVARAVPCVLALALASVLWPADGEAAEPMALSEFGPRDVGKIPDGWEELKFDEDNVPRPSRYQVVRLDGRPVLKGTTDGGASGLFRPVNVDPKKHPYIAWRWRIEQVYPKADGRRKSGDDYPARLYVAFKYDSSRVGWGTRLTYEYLRRQSPNDRYPPLYALDYVWASRLKAGTWLPNPWEGRAKMIVLRSGKRGLGEWHRECRNYVRDFKAIVDEALPEVEYVAVMIDGDNTKFKGVAYFADIEFRAAPSPGFDADALDPPKRLDD